PGIPFHAGGWSLPLILLDHAMEQLLQVLVVGLQAAHDDVVELGQLEESLRRPAGGDLHAVLATAIVVENLHPFKAQVVEKAVRVALNLQAVAIVTPAAKLRDGSLAQDAPLVQDDHGVANRVHVAQKMGGEKDRL